MTSPAPSDPIQRVLGLLRELRRRKVYRVAVVYVIGAVAGLQLMDALVPVSRLPDWSDELFLALAVFGFPLAIILAWAFELTPDGLRLTETPDGVPAGGSAYPMAGLLLLIAAAASVWWYATRDHNAEPVPAAAQTASQDAERERQVTEASGPTLAAEKPFIAVLPLENLSPDEANAYFAAGIHEEILTQLSKIAGLGVFARTTMNQYRNTDRSIFEIGRELKARAVLEGSVRRAGDRVRITAQLVDPQTQGYLWSETYDRRLDDVFAVQEDIARRVVENLAAQLSPAEDRRIASRPTANLAAYDLYLRGRDAYRKYDGEANREAVRLFGKALELDPGYALAWAGLGEAYAQRDGRFGYPHGGPAETAVKNALKSLELDPELAEGYVALGDANYKLGRQEEALDAFVKGVHFDPNNYAAAAGLAIIHYNLGRFDESVKYAEQSARLAPNEIGPRLVTAHVYKFLRMDEQARQWHASMLALDPQNVSARLLTAQYATYEGDCEGALAEVEGIIRDQPEDPYAWTGAAAHAYMCRDYGLAVARARESLRLAPGNTMGYLHQTGTLLALAMIQGGDAGAAGEVPAKTLRDLQQRVATGERRWNMLWDLAALQAAGGDVEGALNTFEQAYGEGFRFVRWPPFESAFDGLRENPRYLRLMERMEADVEAMRARVMQQERQGVD